MHLRTALLERLDRARPRVVLVVADAGWGKSTFLRALAARTGPSALIDAADATTREALERRLLDALAQDRAHVDAASAVEAWAEPGPPVLVALDDVDALDDAAVDLVRALLRALPPGRTLVLASRTPPPFALSRYFAPHEIVTLGTADLALSDAESRAAIGGPDVDTPTLDRAVRLARGWPIAVYLFARFARESRLAALLDRLEDRAFADLHAYVEAELLADLAREDLEVLELCASAPTIEEDDVRGVLGEEALARARSLVAEDLYLLEEDRCFHAPLLETALRRRRAPELAALLRRCAEAREQRGSFIEAADAWLRSDDAARAVAALDRIGPPTPGIQPSSALLHVLVRIPLAALLRSPHAYVVLLTSPGVAASPNRLAREAQRVCESLDDDADPGLRFSAQLAYATLLLFASQIRRADDVLAALDVPAPDAGRHALLTATQAAVASLRGRTVDARRLWTSLPLEDAAGRTIYEVQRFAVRVGIALSGGRHDDLVPDIRRQLSIAYDSGDPVWIADVRAVDLMFSGRERDRIDADRRLRAMEDERLRREGAEAYGHIVRPTEVELPWRNVLSCLVLMDMAYAQDDPDTARHLIDEAITTADHIGRRHYQIGTRLLAAYIPGTERARLFDEARRLAADVQDPVTAASVEALAGGRFTDAPAFRSIAHRIARARFDVPEHALRVEILAGRVTRSGAALQLRAREFEVVAALALAHAPLSRATLAARLWDEHDDDGAPALRTAVHRVRKQLGDPDAIVSENGTYALGKAFTVDVRDIEATLAALQRLRELSAQEQEHLERLARALAAPLPEVYARWPWIQPHLAGIAELRHRATLLLGERALAGGASADAVAIADAALRAEPLDEPVAELAVRGLLASGRRAEAARRARRYADDLARELGGEPASRLLRDLAKL